MRLYIIRHGETDWNKEKRLQGRADIPLNAYGVELAEKTSEALQEVAFDVAFTSPLQRAKKTAEIILRGRDIPIIEDERIIEIGFGSYEGLSCAKEHFEIPDPNFNAFFKKPEAYQPPEGGESFEEVRQRSEDFLKELYKNETYQESTILISTHGAALCGLLSVIKNNPIEKYWEGGLHKNCGLSIVDVKNAKAEIIKEAIVLYESE